VVNWIYYNILFIAANERKVEKEKNEKTQKKEKTKQKEMIDLYLDLI